MEYSEKIAMMESDLERKESEIAILMNERYDNPQKEGIQEEIEILEKSVYRLEREIKKEKEKEKYGEDVVSEKEEKEAFFLKRVKEELPYIDIEHLQYEGCILTRINASFNYQEKGEIREMFNEEFSRIGFGDESYGYGFTPNYFQDEDDFINRMKDYKYAFNLLKDKLVNHYGIKENDIHFDGIHLDWDREDVLYYSFLTDGIRKDGKYIYNASEKENLFALDSFFTNEIRGIIRNERDCEGELTFALGLVPLKEFLQDGDEVEIKIISRK